MTPQACPYTYPREAASLKSHYLSTSSLQCSAQKCLLKIVKLSYRLHAFMWLCPHLYSLSLRQQCRKTLLCQLFQKIPAKSQTNIYDIKQRSHRLPLRLKQRLFNEYIQGSSVSSNSLHQRYSIWYLYKLYEPSLLPGFAFPHAGETARKMSSIHMLLNFPVVCSANYWDLKVLNQFLHIIFLCKGKGYRVSVLRFSRLAVLVRLCVSFHHNPFPIPLIIYSLGMYILMYRIHVLMPALLPLPTADMFSPCICEKQVLENNISEKH